MRSLVLRCSASLIACASIVTAHAQQFPFAQKPFTDVPEGSTYFQAVEYLRVNNIVKGYLDGTFRANKKITRAEFLALMTNPFFLSGRSDDCLKVHFSDHPSTRVFFTDVTLSAWYAQDVCEAKVHDIIHGYADGTFRPNRTITFVEAAKVAARVLSLDVARDHPADERWYVVYAQRLSELGAIPTSIRTFTQPITRGEMAEILFRLKVGGSGKASAKFEDLK